MASPHSNIIGGVFSTSVDSNSSGSCSEFTGSPTNSLSHSFGLLSPHSPNNNFGTPPPLISSHQIHQILALNSQNVKTQNSGNSDTTASSSSGNNTPSLVGLNNLDNEDTKTINSFSSLLEAIRVDDKELIVEFCRLNKNLTKLDLRDADGRTPIHYCIEYDSYGSLDIILSSWAITLGDLNLKDKDDWTPLHYAALFDRIECALILVQNGANINCLTNENWTPLHVASWRGHSDFVSMLIEKRAKLSLKTKDGLAAHQLALNSFHFSIANEISEALLIKGDGETIVTSVGNSNNNNQNNNNNINQNNNNNNGNNNNNNGMIDENLNEEVLTMFKRSSKPQLESNINYNLIKDHNGVTPLHLAAISNGVETIVQLITKYGMNVNVPDNSGKTPLHFASYNAQIDAMQTLIANGANVNICLVDHSNHNLILNQYLNSFGNNSNVGVLVNNNLINNGNNNSNNNSVNNNNNNNNGQNRFKKEYGITALMEGAYSSDVKVLSLLLSSGANINSKSYYGTALHFATSVGSVECVKYLLSNGADARIRNDQGMTALHVAAFHGYSTCLSELVLVNGGAEINSKCRDGSTPLMKATMGAAGSDSEVKDIGCNHYQCVVTLLEKGADPNITNDMQESSLHVAAYHGLSDIAQALIGRGSNLESNDKWGECPIHKCVYQNNHRVLEILIEMGSRINSENYEGETALHVAVRKNSSECTHILASCKGVHLNCTNKYGETPLHYACSNGLIELSMMFLEKGAVPHIPDSQGDIPLMVALRRGFTEISLTLIRWGVQGGKKQSIIKNELKHSSNNINTNATSAPLSIPSLSALAIGGNSSGSPSSSSLTIGGSGSALQFQHHASFSIVSESPMVSPMLRANNYNEHALHAAAMAGYSDCVLALLGVGADINQPECYGNTPLHGACYTENADLVDMMITMGADVNRTNKDLVTPLHVAALMGNSRVVEILVSRGANCTLCDKNGDTPLHGASLAGDILSIQYILIGSKNNNANGTTLSVDVKNAKQWTPLHMSASSGHIKSTKFLIQNGANPNIKNASNDTPYDQALSAGHVDISSFLKNIKPKKSLKNLISK